MSVSWGRRLGLPTGEEDEEHSVAKRQGHVHMYTHTHTHTHTPVHHNFCRSVCLSVLLSINCFVCSPYLLS